MDSKLDAPTMSLNDTVPLLVDVAFMDVGMTSNVLIMVIVGGN